MNIVITINGTEHTGELVSAIDNWIEVCYEHAGTEHYGWAARSALIVHGTRTDPWYDLDGGAIDWTTTKDLDNLETWE